MKDLENNAYFWQKIDSLYLSGDFKVLYKKGTKHPNFPNLVFPADYGMIETLSSNNKETIRFYRGNKSKEIDAVVISANILEREIRAVVLVGLSEKEEQAVLTMMNQTEYQKAVLIRRGQEVPSWATSE